MENTGNEGSQKMSGHAKRRAQKKQQKKEDGPVQGESATPAPVQAKQEKKNQPEEKKQNDHTRTKSDDLSMKDEQEVKETNE
jgi:hypothetical protein